MNNAQQPAGAGDQSRPRSQAGVAHEYEALAKYFPGPEARCRLALILKEKGDEAGARSLFEEVVRESEIAGRHYASLHKKWVSLARRETKG